MLATATVRGQSHAKCGEEYGVGEAGIPFMDGAEKSTKSLKLAMVSGQ